jgi:hypothetical protein
MGFADTSSDTAARLNECIEEVHESFQAQNAHSLVPIEIVGIPNSCWHMKVVHTAFKLRQKPFTFKKVPCDQWAKVLLDTSNSKCYLVIGLLNTSFRGRKGTNKKEEIISQLFDPSVTIDGNWKHSAAVMHGYVVDDTWVWEDNGIMPAKYLWLLGNKPDHSKGFFKDICKVYEVDCGQPSEHKNVVATNILAAINNSN